jgi:hypothetical protein
VMEEKTSLEIVRMKPLGNDFVVAQKNADPSDERPRGGT